MGRGPLTTRRAYLLRHASSTGQEPDAPLSADGAAQAEALVASLTGLPVGDLYASPYRRAQQTIAPYAAHAGKEVTLIDGLRERLLSPIPLSDWMSHIARSFEDLSYACPGGESFDDVRARGAEALSGIPAQATEPPLFVTHGNWISAQFQGAGDFGFEDWRGLRNPDLFEVTVEQGVITTFARKELT